MTKPQPVPDGYTTVTPWIISRDTGMLIDFAMKAFGAEEIDRVLNEDGSVGHAEIRIGNAIVMMFDSKDEWVDTPCFLRLYVEDARVTFQEALAAGATALTEVTPMFWGDLVGRVRDPLGNVWWLQTRVEEVGYEEMAKRMQQPKYVEAMKYVQSAEIAPLRT